ncbi:MAG: FAD-dependent oxidoreductase [Alphaproteobacteria bacterium]|nr:FAD-dependent oxidoreductase [Alphaproteobacteria bacterium]
MFNPLPYRQYPLIIPTLLVWIIRLLVLVLAMASFAFAILSSSRASLNGIESLVIHSLFLLAPLLMVSGLSIWRQYCPVGFFNQIPRTLGWKAKWRLNPSALKVATFLSTMSFMVLVWLVAVFPLGSWWSLLIASFMGLALLGGVLFAGKSGWCGTFCPLSSFEYSIGYAPVVVHPNRYCNQCVLCMKECMDYTPRNSFLQHISIEAKTGNQSSLFLPHALPGIMFATWQPGVLPSLDSISVANIMLAVQATNWVPLLSYIAVSLAFFSTLRLLFSVPVKYLLMLSTLLFLFIFYQNVFPLWLTTVTEIAQSHPTLGAGVGGFLGGIDEQQQSVVGFVIALIIALGFVAVSLIQGGGSAEGLTPTKTRVSLSYARQRFPMRHKAASVTGERTDEGGEKGGEQEIDVFQVNDRFSGHTFRVDVGSNLLSSLIENDVPIDVGCRQGHCGVCPVAVFSDTQGLAPPSTREDNVLWALGYRGSARLACCLTVQSDMTIEVLNRTAQRRRLSLPNIYHHENVPSAFSSHGRNTSGERFIVVGGGIVAIIAAITLKNMAPLSSVMLVSDKTQLGVNRLRLLADLSVEESKEGSAKMPLFQKSHLEDMEIVVRLNESLLRVETNNKRISTTKNRIEYDKLLICTGASTLVPDTMQKYEGEYVFRVEHGPHIEIVRKNLQETSGDNLQVLVLGGGVSALETALRVSETHQVVLVFQGTQLLENVVDRQGSLVLARILKERKVEIYPENTITRVKKQSGIPMLHVELTEGRSIDCNMILLATGLTANTLFSSDRALSASAGIQVDGFMHSNLEDVFAAGDCIEIAGEPVRRWEDSTMTALIAAESIVGQASRPFFKNRAQRIDLRLPGMQLMSFGKVSHDPRHRILTRQDEADHQWWSVFTNESGYIVGAVFINAPYMQEQIYQAYVNNVNFGSVLERTVGVRLSSRPAVAVEEETTPEDA